jgi:hypothetical protein
MKQIKNFLARASKLIFEASRESARSSGWNRVKNEHLSMNPACAACGSKENLQVHHKMPFHLNPALELDLKNLITLCMEPGVECHLNVGHGDSWKCYNPEVQKDAADLLKNPRHRKEKLLEIKKNRKQ